MEKATKPARKGRKRSAETELEVQSASKKAATSNQKAHAYYIPGLPTNRKTFRTAAVSGIVVAHSENTVKQILFDTFCARFVQDEITQTRAERQVDDWFAGALEVDLSIPVFWRVTNGPPPVLKDKPKDARVSNDSGVKKLFVARDFRDTMAFPGVALIVAPDVRSARSQVSAYISKYKGILDNRPQKIADETDDTGHIEEIDLNTETFYPLVDGQPYQY